MDSPTAAAPKELARASINLAHHEAPPLPNLDCTPPPSHEREKCQFPIQPVKSWGDTGHDRNPRSPHTALVVCSRATHVTSHACHTSTLLFRGPHTTSNTLHSEKCRGRRGRGTARNRETSTGRRDVQHHAATTRTDGGEQTDNDRTTTHSPRAQRRPRVHLSPRASRQAIEHVTPQLNNAQPALLQALQRNVASCTHRAL